MTIKLNEMLTREWAGEIKLRSEEDDGFRRLEALVVPWGVIQTRSYGKERFNRNSLDEYLRKEGPRGIRLRYTHDEPTIGRGESYRSTNDGLVVTFRMANTTIARETMELIDGDFIDGISPEFRVRSDSGYKITGRGENMLTTFKKVELFGAAVVHNNAYKEAKILNLREETDIVTPRLNAWETLWKAKGRKVYGHD